MVIAYIVANLISLLLSIGIWSLALPAISLANAGFWALVVVIMIIFIIMNTLATCWTGEVMSLPLGIVCVVGGVILVLYMVLGIGSTGMFHASDYRNSHDVINSSKGAIEVLPTVSKTGDILVVDANTAKKLGDRAMGVMEKYLSQYEVSADYTLIHYQGRTVWVSSLEYGSYWKFKSSKNIGIPACVLVDAYTGEAEVMEFDEDSTIQYARSAFWDKDLHRYLRKQYPSAIFGAKHFEIDDEGKPYQIIETVKPTAGTFGCNVLDGVIVLNAATGWSQRYSIDEVPAWVDQVFSVPQLMKQVNWHYKYVNGAFNFARKDVRKTSYQFGLYYLLDRDNSILMYTGVTSAGSDESNIGFMYANLRTGEATYYSDPGAEESSAQETAKGLVQQYGYSAGHVALVNVGGKPTYFLPLKDKQHLIKRYALVDKTDYTLVAVEETIEQVVASYCRKVGGELIIEAEQGERGVVESVYKAIIGGNTTYIFKLEGGEKWYLSDITISYEQEECLQVGANVEVEYMENIDACIVTKIKFE